MSQIEPDGFIRTANLSLALYNEIKRQQELEKEAEYFAESAYLAGLKANYEYLQMYGTLSIRD